MASSVWDKVRIQNQQRRVMGNNMELREQINNILENRVMNKSIHTGGQIDDTVDEILVLNLVQLDENQELPENKVWHKEERLFEAYCAGRNDMLSASFRKIK